MKPNLTNLQRGDVLVCRNGTRRTFTKREGGRIYAAGPDRPATWNDDGFYIMQEYDHWDIVRVIRKKKEKAKKVDRDAAWILNLLGAAGLTYGQWIKPSDRGRLRKIAKRLEGGKP